MKIGLICPSNMLYMPYVRGYIDLITSLNIDYKIINWDRLYVTEEINGHTFRDKKVKHRRNYLDYIKYKRFVIGKIREEKFDILIVFTIQLGHFLKKYLIKNFAGRYILDIRDFNKIISFSDFTPLIESSYSCVISSPGFKEWLPSNGKYVINHNTIISSQDEIINIEEPDFNAPINILTIGILRHWRANIDFVRHLENNNRYNLVFHGEGNINERLKKYIEKHKINNVKINGRYKKEEEEIIYKSTNLVNISLYDDNINCRTLLTNRLYNSVFYGKPIIAISGTYQANIINKYGIGLVLNSLDNLDAQIDEYINTFSCESYNKGRIEFLKDVINENELFTRTVRAFLR